MNTILTIGIGILILSNILLIYIDRKNLKKVQQLSTLPNVIEELKEEVEQDMKLHEHE